MTLMHSSEKKKLSFWTHQLLTCKTISKYLFQHLLQMKSGPKTVNLNVNTVFTFESYCLVSFYFKCFIILPFLALLRRPSKKPLLNMSLEATNQEEALLMQDRKKVTNNFCKHLKNTLTTKLQVPNQ